MKIDKNGFEIKKNYVSKSIIRSIKDEVSDSKETILKSGVRNADKKFRTVRDLSYSRQFLRFATKLLGSPPEVVRVLYFDKTPDKNWLVSWHQDKTIAVDSKQEIEGWRSWSKKDNTYHVQPSLDVLNQIVTFRLHLDDADKNNGCLKVIPESHNLGILPQNELVDFANTQEPYFCEVEAGDLLVMKPLIFHSSSKSVNAKHRRVIHIEYSNFVLPPNLNWT